MRKSNYDKSPFIQVEGDLFKGWEAIHKTIAEKCHSLQKKNYTCVIECYQGVYLEEIAREVASWEFDSIYQSNDFYKSVKDILRMTQPWLTNDRIFGKRAPFTFDDFLNKNSVELFRNHLASEEKTVLIFGAGSAEILPEADIIIYVDMARWEIQQRSRRKEIDGLGVHNREEESLLHYKRGYFIDWIVCDALKKNMLSCADFWMDTHTKGMPKMITGDTLRLGLTQTAHRPFRVVPFFDPAPWGGQWMKKVCGLDPSQVNYGWCFDCVPEENSLYFNIQGELFEMASNNVVFYQSHALLGSPVESLFGQEFPIRFDFLDTMGGGNLSLQVHPTTKYIRDTFGMNYTQDESYYLLDVEEEANVYLGLKTGVNPQEMIDVLNHSQVTGEAFDVEKYVNKWPAKKHDHYLIPNGTVHCSGAGAMVLEISATPSIFTFKLYDWGRLGLDGLPRPINIEHGSKVIQWERQTELIRKEFINTVTVIDKGNDWVEEKTGLHQNEFIETRRHWFTGLVHHNTEGIVNVLNVIQGDELIVESPTNSFESFVVHYAETFIIPASVNEYTIRPYGKAVDKKCGTIKAFVRFNVQ